MVLKRTNWLAGRLLTLEHTSKVLADNPLGDPTTRLLDVWLPPQYVFLKIQCLYGCLFEIFIDLTEVEVLFFAIVL